MTRRSREILIALGGAVLMEFTWPSSSYGSSYGLFLQPPKGIFHASIYSTSVCSQKSLRISFMILKIFKSVNDSLLIENL